MNEIFQTLTTLFSAVNMNNRILGEQTLRYARETLAIFTNLKKMILSVINTTNCLDCNNKELLAQYSEFQFSSTQGSQNERKMKEIFCYLLQKIIDNGYRKDDKNIYVEVKTPEGKSTRFFQQAMKIKEFVQTSFDKHLYESFWAYMLEKWDTRVKNLTKYFEEAADPEFPKLEVDRNLISFRNGIWNVDGLFMEYGSEEMERFFKTKPHVTTMNYFECEFKHEWLEQAIVDPFQIDTPSFDSIFKVQKLTKIEIEVVYAAIGSLMTPMNTRIKGNFPWLYLFGRSGTGKSTLLDLIAKMFPHHKIGIISAECHKTFPLEGLSDKYICICPEVKRKFNLPAALFQSMASGEWVSVTRRFKDERQIKWNIPCVFAGNVDFPYENSVGEISRRILRLKFLHEPNRDPQFIYKLQEELPRIMVKCRWIFLFFEQQKLQEGTDIWGKTPDGNAILPPYFHTSREELTKKSNSILNFLTNCDAITFDSTYFTSLSDFKESYINYCKKQGLITLDINPDISFLFEGFGCKIVYTTLPCYKNKKNYKTFFVQGLQIMYSNNNSSYQLTTSSNDEDEIMAF
jgi:energy-coupling factor transporter ATP-binding protein EcfA2